MRGKGIGGKEAGKESDQSQGAVMSPLVQLQFQLRC